MLGNHNFTIHWYLKTVGIMKIIPFELKVYFTHKHKFDQTHMTFFLPWNRKEVGQNNSLSDHSLSFFPQSNESEWRHSVQPLPLTDFSSKGFGQTFNFFWGGGMKLFFKRLDSKATLKLNRSKLSLKRFFHD